MMKTLMMQQVEPCDNYLEVNILFQVQSYNLYEHRPDVSYFKSYEQAAKHAKSVGGGDVIIVVIQSNYPLNYFEGCTYSDLTYGKCDAYVYTY